MLSVLVALVLPGNTLTVGPGKSYARIEDALAAASPGDTIRVYPDPGNYAGTNLLIRKDHLTIVGIGEQPVKLDGAGFDYSGTGLTPRAIFQVEPGSDGDHIVNFDLYGAHNGSYNGAAVRINQAKNVTVDRCDIHDNDMGIMSNGLAGDEHAAEDQMIDHCRIHGNGNSADPGQNHNLYLGGTSVTVQFCEIFASKTGHNLKSRAHFNLIRYCYIHDSSNRELDLVDGFDTERPHSNVVLLGNVIVKSPEAQNRAVIHFGQERGTRTGTLFMINNTVLTPFAGPVIEFDSPTSRLAMYNNVVVNSQQSRPTLVGFANGTSPSMAVGSTNWLSKSYNAPSTLAIDLVPSDSYWPFWSEVDYRLNASVVSHTPFAARYRDGLGRDRTGEPRYRFAGGRRWDSTQEQFLGAG